MILKEQLEILRGEPFQVFAGNPKDIPCIETSDPDKLCKHPVVTVHMITYNHEPYIRQAIEGVMMQKTDFEFELIIGEDCSTDKTREICFEYQKRYPDKIRVLWCDYNLYRNPHPAGENGERNAAHWRGEFLAFCEGDDYWIDPLKLQKQVDVMRKHPNVGICFSRVKRLMMSSGKFVCDQSSNPPVGLIAGKDFGWWNIRRKDLCGYDMNQMLVQTSGILIRRKSHQEAVSLYSDFAQWRLGFGDTKLTQLVSSVSDVYFLPGDYVSVYRVHGGGLTSVSGASLIIDYACVLVPYFAVKQFGMTLRQVRRAWDDRLFRAWESYLLSIPKSQRKACLRKLFKAGYGAMLLSPWNFPRLCMLNFERTERFRAFYWRYMHFIYPFLKLDKDLVREALARLKKKISNGK